MKTLLILLFAITSLATTEKSQETEKVNATYTEYEDGIYFFTDSDGYSIEFNNVSDEVLKKYDLYNDEYIGKLFIVTYQSDTEMDEEGDDVASNTIIDLKLVE